MMCRKMLLYSTLVITTMNKENVGKYALFDYIITQYNVSKVIIR